ncbi:ATP-binding protein [Flagellimonas flava]|uniref:ATPase family associated with various cellular activities (AAA) n=1 Tax=Flagellimonas flava TaxID=570519 RepID=A0A1M5IR70_9FLAO|nr:ATP-binding protein [Allomuricauda flava]SHG30824.1 ATPase family associated with various cellular activities (AAA) [Allomuricauda flava]
MVNLFDTEHPNKSSEKQYDELIGIDENKSNLLSSLSLLLDSNKIKNWHSKHHKKEIALVNQIYSGTPLVILSGDVGCGKTALAQSIGTPLSCKLDKKIIAFETPSNIRGSGLVGEISNRITEAFDQAKRKLGKDKSGILIIDEADDIATSRSQNQAHHEDRAGLNVLIKQIDLIRKDAVNLAVILITNRVDALDPAVRRRTSLHLVFERPTGEKAEEVVRYILKDIEYDESKLDDVMNYIKDQRVPYSFSDLIHRVAKQAIYKAIEIDKPFTIDLFKSTLENTIPSPLID